jgi:AMP phosphorylase
MSYFLKSKRLDIAAGIGNNVVLNTKEAEHLGIHPGDKVSLKYGKSKIVYANVDTSSRIVKSGEIGLFEKVWKRREVKNGDVATVSLEGRPLSVETLKKKMLGQACNYKEFYALIKDISDGKFSQIETTYYAASGFVAPYTDDELYYVAKAMAETGEKFNLRKKVVDKHSVGGLAGNRSTPIITSIIASLGLIMPKTSSRAITSPAGTADAMEVLCKVSFNLEDIKKIIKKTNACLVWGGGLRMAPADDKIIKVSKPLSLESYDKMIVSIMAKKVATGVDYLVIDIPVGKSCKVPTMKLANDIEQKFVSLGKKFKMKVKVVKTPAKEPIGRGIGPALESREVLRVLQQHKFRSLDLENKACMLAGTILELKGYCKKGNGMKIAKEQVKNGEAWKKLNQIIVAQKGQKDINSEEVMKEVFKYEIHAKKSGKITFVDNKNINEVCMNLGAPTDKYSGIHTHVRYGQRIKKDDKLYTMYTSNEERLKLGKMAAENNVIFVIG